MLNSREGKPIPLSSNSATQSAQVSGRSTPRPHTKSTFTGSGPASQPTSIPSVDLDRNQDEEQAQKQKPEQKQLDAARKAEIAAAKAQRRAEFEGNATKKAEIARLAEERRAEKLKRQEDRSRYRGSKAKADGN
jgi:hypothetical protein